MVDTLRKRGKVLIPVFALGRTQELLLLLNEYWEKHPEISRHGNIVYLNPLAKKSMMLFQAHNPRVLSHAEIHQHDERIHPHAGKPLRSPQRRHPRPHRLRFFPFFWHHRQFLRDFNKLPPCVILCSPAMMENGTSRDVLERMASGENNLVILTGYCMAVLPRF